MGGETRIYEDDVSSEDDAPLLTLGTLKMHTTFHLPNYNALSITLIGVYTHTHPSSKWRNR